jgi:hypothetical protein
MHMMHRTPDKLPGTYLLIATLVTNTLIALLLINAVLAGIYHLRDRPVTTVVQKAPKPIVRSDTPFFYEDGSPVDNGKRSTYQTSWFDFNAYENIDPNYAAEVLDGFWGLGEMGLAYEPWVGFAEPPFASKLVNVDTDPHGFPVRRTINPPNDHGLPTVLIFVMGGSPTFAYNVSDEHTWASQLSKILNKNAEAGELGIHVEVVNYGKGYYYPSQETTLLVDLLKNGPRPTLVIFLDGVNLGAVGDVPKYTEELTREMAAMQFVSPVTERFSWIPVMRLAGGLHRKLFSPGPPAVPEPSPEKQVDYLVNMFDRNMEMSRAVAILYGTGTLFFLEPHVAYHYSTSLFRRPVTNAFKEDQKLTEMLYPRLKPRTGRIDLSELFYEWGAQRKAIIDDVHYSPGFNEFLARHIASHVDLRSLAKQIRSFDGTAAAASSRRRPGA